MQDVFARLGIILIGIAAERLACLRKFQSPCMEIINRFVDDACTFLLADDFMLQLRCGRG